MKRSYQRREGKTALDLIEEATHVVRTAPMATLAVYYAGAIPFVLGFLYFWADMSRSPFASQHLVEAALGMTLLFLWMKFCQSMFAWRIRAQLRGEPARRWDARRCLRVFLTQAAVQPLGLFVLPLSLLAVLPFAWTYAFCQNATALADDESGGASKLVKNSWKQASIWPIQNHMILGFMLAFAGLVFLNWVIVCLMLPGLVKMLFGLESVFTRSPIAMLNTTFFTAMFGLTYLCVDPVMKVVYVLRSFYGESLKSGEDIKAEVKQFAPSAQQLAAGLAILLALASTAPARAADSPKPVAPAASPAVSPPDLDRAINEIIHERKYTWRMPREKISQTEADKGIITRFMEKVGNLVRKWTKAAWEWVENILRRIFQRKLSGSSDSSGYGWMVALQMLLYVLVAAAIIALIALLYRVWRKRHETAVLVSEPIQPAPDLADENVGADQLPEDGWMRLARELLERGEFRLAMRAFYLASLAHLAQRNLISIARFKSNLDYQRELQRRGHSLPGLLSTFGENLSVFERIWYGLHDVNGELVARFAANVETMRITGA